MDGCAPRGAAIRLKPVVDDPPRGRCVLGEGFSLHAGVFVDELDGEALERLARYCARPPLVPGAWRTQADDGQILYRVKHAAPGVRGSCASRRRSFWAASRPWSRHRALI